jgi:hypothetical protein
MGRWQSHLLDSFDHLERGHHPPSRLREVQHHPVAEPLDGPASMLPRGPLHEPRHASGKIGGGLVPGPVLSPLGVWSSILRRASITRLVNRQIELRDQMERERTGLAQSLTT